MIMLLLISQKRMVSVDFNGCGYGGVYFGGYLGNVGTIVG